MAKTSGSASSIVLPSGTFTSPKSGATFEVSWNQQSPQFKYTKTLRDGTVISGSRSVTHFIGSGAHARGLIFKDQNQPFQAPIAYYGPNHLWNSAPGYEVESSIILGRKIEFACLNCHASGVTANEASLFSEGSVSCERCHGPGNNHVRAMNSGSRNQGNSIVNPTKLSPERRDSICAQCHLTGETRIPKVNRSEATFRPGDKLAEHVVPFVRSQDENSATKVIGHFEGLWKSQCKLSSGDRLWCGTCHNPHQDVPDNQKGAYYRNKCLGCHQVASCTAPRLARVAKQDGCASCHMPSTQPVDGQHTAFTDHRIQRTSRQTNLKAASALREFWPGTANSRDYALAYAENASSGTKEMRLAYDALRTASQHFPDDPELASQLGYREDQGGNAGFAQRLYALALKQDPFNLLALSNNAAHLARAGDLIKAIELWKRALAVNPGLESPRLNLSRAQNSLGLKSEALKNAEIFLRFYPDSPKFAGHP